MPAPKRCRTPRRPNAVRSMRLAASVIALGMAIGLGGPGAISPAQAQGADEIVAVGQGSAIQRVNLGLNKTLVIDLPRDAADLLVARPEIADAVTRSARRIYLFGRAVGETNIFVFDENGDPIANIDLQVERDVSSLESDLERFIPGADIEVEVVSNNVVLQGVVLTPQDADRALQLAAAFLNSRDGGSAPEGDEQAVINLLTIAGQDQVTLKLTIAELQRTVAKQLGLTLSGGIQTATLGDGIAGLGGLTATGGVSGNTGAGVFGASADVGIGDFSANLQATLNALNSTGMFRTLAEPTLTAISGEEAQFRVGGAIAVRVRTVEDGVSNFNIETINFGVEMNFKPVVLSSGRISVGLGVKVSEPVPGGTDGVNTLFTLRERVASTSVELPSGGSFMIAGLINDSLRQNVTQTPGLSRLPILGPLFRSRDYLREETEMVVIATPYLVRPVAPSALQRPDDNFHPANDSQGFFLGRLNKIYGNSKAPDAPFHGNVGFVYK